MRGAALLLALAAAQGACSLLVPGTLGPISCLDEGAVGPPACPPGQTCTQGVCVEGTTDLGKACKDQRDCGAEWLCVDPAAFGGEGERRCSRPCCSAFDCDPRADFVCAPFPGGGGTFCRAAADVGRASTGALAAGQACKEASECRSGLCELSRCADVCCTDVNCAASEMQCSLGAVPLAAATVAGWACGTASGKGYFEPCASGSDCASGLCTDVDGVLRCVTPCCSSSDCPPATDAGGGVVSVGCRWVSHDGVGIPACVDAHPPGGTGLVGAACAAPEDCLSGACADVGGGTLVCTDTCCSDESCGDPALFACRPDPAGSLGLRCEPR